MVNSVNIHSSVLVTLVCCYAHRYYNLLFVTKKKRLSVEWNDKCLLLCFTRNFKINKKKQIEEHVKKQKSRAKMKSAMNAKCV